MERPALEKQDVCELAQRIYGLTITSQEELNSYDDKNYLVKTSRSSSNQNLKDPSRDGYVLKILNSMDSQKVAFVDAMHATITRATEHGIVTPRPLRNCTGKFYSLETLPTTHTKDGPTAEFIVRLFEYIPGELMKGQVYTPYLCYSVGREAGRMDRVLENFNHPGYENHARHWSLTEVANLQDRLIAVKIEQDRQLLQDVIEAFGTNVMKQRDRLRKGVIHADLNEGNIVVKKVNPAECQPPVRRLSSKGTHSDCNDFDMEVSAILDFGDSVFEFQAFELAILMAYVMIESTELDAIEAGGHTLTGFLCEFPLPTFDLSVLKECICARLAQSLIHGAYEHYLNPDNIYALQTAAAGWPLLRRLWSMDKEELYEQLNTIVRLYSGELVCP